MSISGDTAIVGSFHDDDAGTDSGSAYIFSRNTNGADMWGQVQKLTASDAAADDQFGNSVSISVDTAIVGAFRKDVAAPPIAGEKSSNRKNSLSRSAKTNAPNLVGVRQGGTYIFRTTAAPTAASATVAGRVMTNTERGIGRTFVTITDSNGESETLTTNIFGYFRFRNIEAGETYILSVRHKVYNFQPDSQVVNVNDDLTDISFIGYTK